MQVASEFIIMIDFLILAALTKSNEMGITTSNSKKYTVREKSFKDATVLPTRSILGTLTNARLLKINQIIIIQK